MVDILSCEGYKMFRGTMIITPTKITGLPPFSISGVWLYKPESRCWYCNGRSFTEEVCTIDQSAE